MLPIAYSKNLTAEQIDTRISDLQQVIHDSFHQRVQDYATEQGLKLVAAGAEGGYRVTVKTNPPGGAFHYVHLVTWMRAQKEGKNPILLMKSVMDGQTADVAGTEVVMVTFKNGARTIPSTYMFLDWGTVKVDASGSFIFVHDK